MSGRWWSKQGGIWMLATPSGERTATTEESLLIDYAERVQEELDKLRAFVADQPCDCTDEYQRWRPEPCDRCRLVATWDPGRVSEHPKLKEKPSG